MSLYVGGARFDEVLCEKGREKRGNKEKGRRVMTEDMTGDTSGTALAQEMDAGPTGFLERHQNSVKQGGRQTCCISSPVAFQRLDQQDCVWASSVCCITLGVE